MTTTNDDGAFAALAWLRERDPTATSNDRWYAEIALDVIDAPADPDFDEATATRFHLDIYREEWGVWFCHRGRSSRIVCSDAIRVHGADHYNLLAIMPRLRDIGGLIRRVESAYGIVFARQHAAVCTNLPSLEPAIRAWVQTL
ncbi:MAG: hypothetical protein ABJE66_20550 [Deltaproteobacteria bacterium]